MTGSELAADRVTVKVAATVPVFPSVTVTVMDGDRLKRRRRECRPVAVVEQDRDRASLVVAGGRDVREAVVVEVPDRQRPRTHTRVHAEREGLRSDEGAVPAAQERSTDPSHVHRRKGQDEVEMPVAVEVGCRQTHQAVSADALTVDRVAERAVAAAGPDDHTSIVGRSGQECRRW